jgi:nucleoside 2-deoxyribosyltransferase
MNKKIYVAGPMTDYPENNFPAFYVAEKQLRKAGFKVINPARLSKKVAKKYNFSLKDHEACKKHVKQFMKEDLKGLLKCDFIYMLKGWRDSKGANIEYNTAKETGMCILMEELVIKAKNEKN